MCKSPLLRPLSGYFACTQVFTGALSDRNGRCRHGEIGYNSRLDEIQAAVLRVKLPYLNGWNRQRCRIAAQYRTALRNTATACGWPTPIKDNTHVYHQFVVMHPQRDALQAFLAEHDVATGVSYATPCHLQPAFSASHGSVPLPQAERFPDEVLALPVYPELSEEVVAHIAKLIQVFEQRQ